MTPENFVYWLQGFMEIGNPKKMSKEQVQEIKNHLSLVLRKETPHIKIKDHVCIAKYGERKCKYCGEECNAIELNDVQPYISREQTWPQRLPEGVSFCASATSIAPLNLFEYKDGTIEKVDKFEFRNSGIPGENGGFHINAVGQIVSGSGSLKDYYEANGFYPPGYNGPSSWDFVRSDGPPMSC